MNPLPDGVPNHLSNLWQAVVNNDHVVMRKSAELLGFPADNYREQESFVKLKEKLLQSKF
jgi:hypothetical protein